MTWEEAFAYVDTVLERECAEQGMTVEITDQRLLTLSANLLRRGKENHDALRLEESAATSRR